MRSLFSRSNVAHHSRANPSVASQSSFLLTSSSFWMTRSCVHPLVFVMPSLTLPHATDAAIDWHGRVASQDFWLDRERRTSVTVSIGVAEGHACGARSPEDLLRLADAALYDAKRGGRNRVVTYDRAPADDEQRVA